VAAVLEARLMEQAPAVDAARELETAGVFVCAKGYPIPAPDARPGALDRGNFQCGPGVDFWANYESATADTLVARVQQEVNGVRKEFDRPADAPYWTYHLFRTGFFTAQGFAGVVAAQLTNGSSLTPAGSGNDPTALVGAAGRLVLEAVDAYKQDYRNILEGKYKQPWDMQPGHRQFNPLFVLNKAQRFVRESVHILDAKDRGASTDVWNQESKLYPKYFKHAFHHQKDGWFSQDSAKVYESSTETLFVGRQDAMQRGTLVPFARFMNGACPGSLSLWVASSSLSETHQPCAAPCKQGAMRLRRQCWRWRRARGASTRFFATTSQRSPPCAATCHLSTWRKHATTWRTGSSSRAALWPGAGTRRSYRPTARTCRSPMRVSMLCSTCTSFTKCPCPHAGTLPTPQDRLSTQSQYHPHHISDTTKDHRQRRG
jgi:hypothetical protein